MVTKVAQTQSSSDVPMATARLVAGSVDFLKANDISGTEFRLSTGRKSTDSLSRNPDL